MLLNNMHGTDVRMYITHSCFQNQKDRLKQNRMQGLLLTGHAILKWWQSETMERPNIKLTIKNISDELKKCIQCEQPLWTRIVIQQTPFNNT